MEKSKKSQNIGAEQTNQQATANTPNTPNGTATTGNSELGQLPADNSAVADTAAETVSATTDNSAVADTATEIASSTAELSAVANATEDDSTNKLYEFTVKEFLFKGVRYSSDNVPEDVKQSLIESKSFIIKKKSDD